MDRDEDLRTRLEAIRDRLTVELAEAKGSELASVARQLRETLAELARLPVSEESAVDELRKRRVRRLGQVEKPAGGKVVRGS